MACGGSSSSRNASFKSRGTYVAAAWLEVLLEMMVVVVFAKVSVVVVEVEVYALFYFFRLSNSNCDYCFQSLLI